MNKKGQMDLSPGGVVMGLLGGAIAFWYANLMSLGLLTKLFAFVVTTGVCYVMASMILDS